MEIWCSSPYISIQCMRKETFFFLVVPGYIQSSSLADFSLNTLYINKNKKRLQNGSWKFFLKSNWNIHSFVESQTYVMGSKATLSENFQNSSESTPNPYALFFLHGNVCFLLFQICFLPPMKNLRVHRWEARGGNFDPGWLNFVIYVKNQCRPAARLKPQLVMYTAHALLLRLRPCPNTVWRCRPRKRELSPISAVSCRSASCSESHQRQPPSPQQASKLGLQQLRPSLSKRS